MNILHTIKSIFVILGFSALLASCGGAGEGTLVPLDRALPTDTSLTLACADVGIQDNTCVLDDPENPYYLSIVSDETKWKLNDSLGSQNLHKAEFYLWATALTQQQKGENQFYTALSLQRLYKAGGSTNAKNQALKAYRAVLDYYYGDETYEDQDNDGTGETAVLVRDRVGEFLVEPNVFPDLFIDQSTAMSTLDSWGYDYDFDNNKVSKK